MNDTYCKSCNKVLEGSPSRKSRLGGKKYCNNVCQQSFQNVNNRQDFLAGKYIGHLIGFKTGSWQRNLLIDIKGYKCRKCGIDSYNGEAITLEVNHIDGDAENNSVENLEFLCPNCHSQTPNFRALNKVSSRTYRAKCR